MELKIIDGKYLPLNFQGPVHVEEAEEFLQRIEMKLRVRRGSFVPMPEYGSRLHLLCQVRRSERQAAARQYVLEALADEKELELETLTLCETAEGSARLSAAFTYKGEFKLNVETEI